MSTRQAFNEPGLIGKLGAFSRNPEARNGEHRTHLAGSRVTLNSELAGVISIGQQRLFIQQMLFDRR